MSGVKVSFHCDYESNSSQVKDQRVFNVVERKFRFLEDIGLSYPSLNVKPLINISHNGEAVWEFYITKKWRCFFTYSKEKNEIVVLKVGNHL